MAETRQSRPREILVGIVMACLLVIGFVVWNADVDTGVSTTVGTESIAPTCDAQGVTDSARSTGGGDGTGDTTAISEPSAGDAPASGSFCQP
ncbi:MAG: hypothetical protein WCP28_21870 [Actinomycetes bacterium]|jgi:hypothetical protein